MIEVKSVSMIFDKQVIFENKSFVFEANRVYAIQGPSGCGKSTLLRIISGLQKPTKGEVLIDGKPVRNWQNDAFMMHQKYSNFLWLTALDNVLLPKKIHKAITPAEVEEAKQILNDIGLGDSIKKFPYEMSGGMNQRLAFARVLFSKPKVVLMDEPTSALDDKISRVVEEKFLKMQQTVGSTAIIVTHDDDVAMRLAPNHRIQF